MVSICAVRTGCGKSQTSRKVALILKKKGRSVAAIRHPMPYGDLVKQKVQRFATYEDMAKNECTIEEREEYEPHVKNGIVVYAGDLGTKGGLKTDVGARVLVDRLWPRGLTKAKAAVEQNSKTLQTRLAEKQRLLSQLDQAKMQEQLNTTMQTLGEAVGQDVPSLDQVRVKIEQRYAKASAAAELEGGGVEAKMLEVEHAAMNNEARVRLEQIRSQLGIAPPPAAEALGAGAPATPDALASGGVPDDVVPDAAPEQTPAPPPPA